jgi:sn-glycerol 3-phosphate transport system permease protein
MRSRSNIEAWLLVLPAVALLALFTHVPIAKTLFDSFFSTPRPNRPARFVGIDNYVTMVTDPIFWQALRNNAIYALGSIPLSVSLALLMALYVNAQLRGRGFLRMAYFTPTVLPMIAVANIWLFFCTPNYGLLDQFLSTFGLSGTNWLGSQRTALACIIVVAVWKEAGFFMVFYLAALQRISPDLKEAAEIEGASRFTFFRRVVFPLTDADNAFRVCQCHDKRFSVNRSHFRLDRRGAEQRDIRLAISHLRNWI